MDGDLRRYSVLVCWSAALRVYARIDNVALEQETFYLGLKSRVHIYIIA